MNNFEISWLAVILASLAAFAIGGIWYGPVFGRSWARVIDVPGTELKNRNMPVVFTMSFLLSFIAAVTLEMFIGPDVTIGFGSFAGLLAGAGWIATFTGIQYLFEKRSLAHFAINAGYSVVTLTVMGAILAVW